MKPNDHTPRRAARARSGVRLWWRDGRRGAGRAEQVGADVVPSRLRATEWRHRGGFRHREGGGGHAVSRSGTAVLALVAAGPAWEHGQRPGSRLVRVPAAG